MHHRFLSMRFSSFALHAGGYLHSTIPGSKGFGLPFRQKLAPLSIDSTCFAIMCCQIFTFFFAAVFCQFKPMELCFVSRVQFFLDWWKYY